MSATQMQLSSELIIESAAEINWSLLTEGSFRSIAEQYLNESSVEINQSLLTEGSFRSIAEEYIAGLPTNCIAEKYLAKIYPMGITGSIEDVEIFSDDEWELLN